MPYADCYAVPRERIKWKGNSAIWNNNKADGGDSVQEKFDIFMLFSILQSKQIP